MLHVILLLAAAAVGQGAMPKRLAADCVDPALLSKSNVKTFPDQFQVASITPTVSGAGFTQVTVAQYFTVAYYDTYKVAVNKKVNETYVLYQCGTQPPAASQIPAGAKLFQVPLMSTAVSDSSILAFMTEIGVLDRVAFTNEYAVDSCLQSLGVGGCKRIAMDPAGWQVNQTLLSAQAQDVDAFFTYTASSDPKSIAVTAASDPGTKNRAEWVKFVSLFFNREAEANAMYSQVDKTYDAIKAAALAAAPADETKRPIVAFLGHQPPKYGEQLMISFAAYKLQYTQDAGARALNATALLASLPAGAAAKYQYGSIALTDMATAPALLKSMLKDVDVVVDESKYEGIANSAVTLQDFLKSYGFTAEDIPNFKFLKNQRVLREDGVTNPDDYTAWFEMAIARPDLVLSDLAQSLYSSTQLTSAVQTAGANQPHFIRNLFTQTPVLAQAKQCPLPGCSLAAVPICPYVYLACDGVTIAYATPQQRCAPACPTTPAGSDSPAPSPVKLAAGMAVASPLLLALAAVLALCLLL